MGKRGPVRKQGAQRRGGGEAPGAELTLANGRKVAIPEPPEDLLPAVEDVWRGLFRSPVARVLDLDADMALLRRWIQTLDEYERNRMVIAVEGPTVIGASGSPVMSPVAQWLKHLESTVSRIEKELGLTPMSRARLGLTIAEAELTAQQLNAMAEGGDVRRAGRSVGDGDEVEADGDDGWDDAEDADFSG